jgi:effector-binding domain-containing protein
MKKIITTCMIATVLLYTKAIANFDFSTLPQELPAYYQSSLQPIEQLKAKLKNNGFQILATSTILKDEPVISISNDELKATNGYLATLQMVVDNVHGDIRVQNPSYFGAAYLKNYHYGQFKHTLRSLEKVLGKMYATEDTYPLKDLADYRFMFGLPQVDDVFSVAEGKDLHKKVNKRNKHIAYTLKLPNGSILIGHKLHKRTNNFLKKIHQEKNVQLLPYESILKDNKITMLAPKYYIALSLPLLSLSEFMKIAITPDQIENDIKRAYR